MSSSKWCQRSSSQHLFLNNKSLLLLNPYSNLNKPSGKSNKPQDPSPSCPLP